MYIYEIFTKYTWNIYAVIIDRIFLIVFFSEFIVNWKT